MKAWDFRAALTPSIFWSADGELFSALRGTTRRERGSGNCSLKYEFEETTGQRVHLLRTSSMRTISTSRS
jgi:hypothetical protein